VDHAALRSDDGGRQGAGGESGLGQRLALGPHIAHAVEAATIPVEAPAVLFLVRQVQGAPQGSPRRQGLALLDEAGLRLLLRKEDGGPVDRHRRAPSAIEDLGRRGGTANLDEPRRAVGPGWLRVRTADGENTCRHCNRNNAAQMFEEQSDHRPHPISLLLQAIWSISLKLRI
jgi:hypothetical protein